MREVKYIIDYRAGDSHLYIGNNGKFLLNLPREDRQKDIFYNFAFNSLNECVEYLRYKFWTDEMYNYFEGCTVEYTILAVEFKSNHINVIIALAQYIKPTDGWDEVLEGANIIAFEHKDGNCAFYGKDLVYLGNYFKETGGFALYYNRIIQYSFDSLQKAAEYAYKNTSIADAFDDLYHIITCRVVVLNRSDIAVIKIDIVE